MQDVVIVAATRTAIGSFQGSLASVSAVDLGAAVIRQLLEQTGLDGAQVDEVIMGQVLTAGAGQNPARQAAIKAGLPLSVEATTVNKMCGSGMRAMMFGHAHSSRSAHWRMRFARSVQPQVQRTPCYTSSRLRASSTCRSRLRRLSDSESQRQ